MSSGFSFSKNSLRNREGVDPRLIEISNLALEVTTVDFGHGPYSGLRAAEEQHQLYTEGKSKLDGYGKIGKHQRGKALDFYAFVEGKASWEHEHLAMVACAFLQAASLLGYRIKWGGLWLGKNPTVRNGVRYGWDCPHIELVD